MMATAMKTKGKVDIFKVAKAATAAEPAGPTKGTTWTVPDGELADAIRDLRKLTEEIDSRKVKIEALRDRLMAHAADQWVTHWCRCAMPEAPIRLANAKGQSVLFVVQDRTRGHAVSNATIIALQHAIGWVDKDLEEVSTYSFNPEILGLVAPDPLTGRRTTIADMISRRLNPLIEDLVGGGHFERRQLEGLLTAEVSRVFKPSFLATLPERCGRDAKRLGRVIAALGSAFVRFIKVS
jgi:hypothetical protein